MRELAETVEDACRDWLDAYSAMQEHRPPHVGGLLDWRRANAWLGVLLANRRETGDAWRVLQTLDGELRENISPERAAYFSQGAKWTMPDSMGSVARKAEEIVRELARPGRPKTKSPALRAEIEERRAKVREQWNSGERNITNITHAVGSNRRTVREDLMALGLYEEK